MVGLPPACTAADDDAARPLARGIAEGNYAIGLMDDAGLAEDWSATLERLADRPDLHGLLAGTACRLLLSAGRFPR